MRILVTDDDPSVLVCTQALLESAGHEVKAFPDIISAWLALCEPVLYDVVICDGFKGRGLSLLAAVRQHHHYTRTILHSADDELVAIEARRGQCAILKGDSWNALLAALQTPAGAGKR